MPDRLFTRLPFAALLAALFAASLAGSSLAVSLPAPGGPGVLAMVAGALLLASPLAAREWVAIRLQPAPAAQGVREPAEVVIPGSVHDRSVAPGPSRRLAVVRPGSETVEQLRSVRGRLRSSTAEDAASYVRHLTAAGSVDPVHDQCARRRALQTLLELVPLSSVVAIAMLTGLVWAAVAAGLAVVLAGLLLRRFRIPVPVSRVEEAPTAGYSPFTEIGCVGGNLAEESTFAGAGAVGIAGEKRTAELLETWLDEVSRVAIFHSLRFPGSSRADIDHIALIGHRLFVIDSKAWRGGAYRQTTADSVVTEGGEVRTSSMTAAAALLSAAGWGDVQVLTVIHATSGAIEVSGAGDGGHMVVTPVDLTRLLMEERDRGGSMLWTPEDAERFEANVTRLRRMLVRPRGDRATSVAPRAA